MEDARRILECQHELVQVTLHLVEAGHDGYRHCFQPSRESTARMAAVVAILPRSPVVERRPIQLVAPQDLGQRVFGDLASSMQSFSSTLKRRPVGTLIPRRPLFFSFISPSRSLAGTRERMSAAHVTRKLNSA